MKKILSTRDLKPGARLRVYKKGYGYAILQVVEAHELYLAALCPNDFAKTASPGDRLKSYLWLEETGTYEFSLTVNGVMTRQHHIVFCAHTEKIARGTSPKCLRARIGAPLRFFVVEPTEMKGFNSERIVFHTGTVVELSDRSALLRYDGILPEGAFVKGRIKSVAGSIDLMGKVYRAAAKGKQYRIDCSAMGERERNAVLDYVFSVYRE